MEGFRDLPLSKQNEIINSQENLQLMLKSANASKGSKVEFKDG